MKGVFFHGKKEKEEVWQDRCAKVGKAKSLSSENSEETVSKNMMLILGAVAVWYFFLRKPGITSATSISV